MAKQKSTWTGVLSALGLILLILDTKTAISGARDGIALCVSSVIPALFPFFVLSALINASVTGRNISVLRPLGRVCGVPQGCDSLLVLGLIGGYPIGAQAVTDAYRSKRINASEAKRLLGFCNNAGPSFIFGMLSSLFTSPASVWVIWSVHILSALLTAVTLPNKSNRICRLNISETASLPKALERSIKVIATVCGWVVLFRVLIAIIQRWFLWLLPKVFQTVFIGFMELTNGCSNLGAVTSESMRFVLCCSFLAMGGLCVLMQTVSVTKPLGLGMYIPGKLLQTLISLILACILQPALFPSENTVPFYIPIAAVIFGMVTLVVLHRKKSSSFMENCVV